MNKTTAAPTNDVPLLSACRAEDRDVFEGLVERRTFPAGETILREGETDHALWLLIRGTCEVVKAGNGHASQQLAVLEAGNVFGEMSFLQPAAHCATVKALTRVEVARLSAASFEQLRQDSPAAAYCIVMNLVQLLSDRLRRMDDRLCELLDGPCTERQSKEWHDFRARLFAGSDFN